MVNNSFVNQRPGGGTFVYARPTGGALPFIENNIFFGLGTLTNQANAILIANFSDDPMFVDLGNFDYHLAAGSPAIDAGVEPGSANGYSLKPRYEYVHPACGERRHTVETIDIGAYEYGGAGTSLTCR